MRARGVGGALLVLIFSLFPSAVFSASPSSATTLYQEGQKAMVQEDWYGAAEQFLEALRINPSYGEPIAALAECYYALGEYDQALSYARRAKALMRGEGKVATLEAFVLIAVGDLDGAEQTLKDVLSREPYQREALFAQAELDVVKGRGSSAAARYREAARRYPQDRRALLSLALVLGSLGDLDSARSYAARAVALGPTDFRARYYAAYLDASAGRLEDAKTGLEATLRIKSNFAPARSLLSSVLFSLGDFEEAARLSDISIAANRQDGTAWYLKGLSYARLGKLQEARAVLSTGAYATGDELVIAALEDLLISSTPLESQERTEWARRRFASGADFVTKNLNDQALFEYRRGLRLDPYSKDGRVAYADLLLRLGYPSLQLGELRFLQDIGKADRPINDAVEAYDSFLADALPRRWGVDPVGLDQRHWKLAIFSLESQAKGDVHPGLSRLAASFVKDLLIHDGDISVSDLDIEVPSFSSAFSAARTGGADYFLVVSASEGDRDLALQGTLYVGRTGSEASSFSLYRTGSSRFKDATRILSRNLADALPFRGRLIARKGGEGLMDKGRLSGVAKDGIFDVLRTGTLSVAPEGVGLSYSADDVTGHFVVTEADEELSAGTLNRSGFFDRLSIGDELVAAPQPEPTTQQAADGSVSSVPSPQRDPKLLSLLRALR